MFDQNIQRQSVHESGSGVKILGCDFETTGLNPETDLITEIGMVMWDTDLRMPIKEMGYVVNPGLDAVWSPEVLTVNKLSPEVCAKYGYEYGRAAKQFFLWYQEADAACAHNGNKVEKPFVKTLAEKYGYDFQPDKLWIDTNTDVPYPPKMSHKLTYLAADHKFLNPFPHTALSDTLTMLVVLDQYPLDKVLELARSPMVIVKALVTFNNNELAKKRGYHAEYKDGKFVMWFREMKELFVEQEREECAAAGFSIEVIK